MKFKHIVFLLSVVGCVFGYTDFADATNRTTEAGKYWVYNVGKKDCPVSCYCAGHGDTYSGCYVTKCANSTVYRSGTCSNLSDNGQSLGIYACPNLTDSYWSSSHQSGKSKATDACREYMQPANCNGYIWGYATLSSGHLSWTYDASGLNANGGYKVVRDGANSYCTPCGYGHYSNSGGTTCSSCDKGTHNASTTTGTSSSVCVACADGEYQDSKGQKDCITCPNPGSGWVKHTDANKKDDKVYCYAIKDSIDGCASGKLRKDFSYSASSQYGNEYVVSESPLSANKGYYVDDKECSACPTGKYCPGETAAPVNCPDPLEKDDNGNSGKHWASSYKTMATAQNVAGRPSKTGAIVFWVKNDENASDNYTSISECTVLVKQSGDGCNTDYEKLFKKGKAGFKYAYSETQGGYYPIGALTKDGVSTVKAKIGYWVWGSHCHLCDEGTVQTSNDNTGGQESCKKCSDDKYAMYDRSACVACTNAEQYADEKICRACPAKPDGASYYKADENAVNSSITNCRYITTMPGCDDSAKAIFKYNETEKKYVIDESETKELCASSSGCDKIKAQSTYYVANSFDTKAGSFCLKCEDKDKDRKFSDGGAIGSDMCYTCGEGRCKTDDGNCHKCSAGYACPADEKGDAQDCVYKEMNHFGVTMCVVDQYSTVSTADGAPGPEKCSSCASGYTTKGSDKCWNQNEGMACYSADACTLKTIKFKIGTETFEWPKCVIQGKIQNQ